MLLSGKFGTFNGPSSGWTSSRSTCSLTAAGMTLLMRAFLCSEDSTSCLQSADLSPNRSGLELLERTQYFLVLSRSFVDTAMRIGAHPSFPTTLCTSDASCRLRGTSFTTTGVDVNLPPPRITSSKLQEYGKEAARHTRPQHTATTIAITISSHADCDGGRQKCSMVCACKRGGTLLAQVIKTDNVKRKQEAGT
ncbi:hypothetical protein TRSC58_06986 [Trypanosoma rangeli SC58]|uniref:Uncharacterized protein n=1 Tax=Trypanosoma rangeli SC58 TaxID=429131 RepID=A0A061IWG2_TRYRA|nr:hypothetical protein TRSC58_06986 [Trypanosoma rangeli SC58]